MRTALILFFSLLVASLLAAALGSSTFADEEASSAPVIPVEVVARFPHDRGAFTQGLVIAGGKLFEGTGQYGRSSLREVDLQTGRVVRGRRLASELFGEGIVVWRDRIVQLTWRAGVGLVYDKESFRPLGTFRYEGEGWGLTHDGAHLIQSDGTSSLRYLDPESYRVVKRIDVKDAGRPVTRLNELEYVDGLILANVWGSDRVALIRPESGAVAAWLDLSHLYPAAQRPREAVVNGIAYDAEAHRLYVTGKNWPALYEIRPRIAPGGWFDRGRNGRGD